MTVRKATDIKRNCKKDNCIETIGTTREAKMNMIKSKRI